MTRYKIWSWLFLVLALIFLGITIYIYYQISSACIPSWCGEPDPRFFNMPICTADCSGARSYTSVIIVGLIDIFFWIFWLKKL